jgi:hypothetical protein
MARQAKEKGQTLSSLNVELAPVGAVETRSSARESAHIEQPEQSYRSHVGLNGTFVLLLALAICGLFVYLGYEYSRKFLLLRRPWVWVFFVVAGLYLLLLAKFLLFWRKIATEFAKAEVVSERKKAKVHSGKAASGLKRSSSVSKLVRGTKTAYADFKPDGRLFLWKLYASQVSESAAQAWNLVTVYLCSMPVEITIPMCAVMALECFFTANTIRKRTQAKEQNRQMLLDVCMDLFCITMPLSVLWFAYKVPIHLSEMFQVTLIASLSLLMKLDDLMEEIIRERASRAVIRSQARASLQRRRSRQSIFGSVRSEVVTEAQKASVPEFAKNTFAALKALFGILFLSAAMVHLATFSSLDCTGGPDSKQIWNGCLVKVPFCRVLLEPSCNCAVLEVKRHNMTTLPRLVDELEALKRVEITHGPLRELPEGFGKLRSLAAINVDNNALEFIPPFSTEDTPRLTTMFSYNNKIQKIPDSLWHHTGVVEMDLESNFIREIPRYIERMESLGFLNLMDNRVSSIPPSLFKLTMLNTLQLDRNNITHIPIEILNRKDHGFEYLTLAGNHIAELPERFFEFKARNLDLRNNSLKVLPKWTSESAIGDHFFLAGNPVCWNEALRAALSEEYRKELDRLESQVPPEGCTPQCALTCYDYYREGDQCDRWCNVEECQYDNGACYGL